MNNCGEQLLVQDRIAENSGRKISIDNYSEDGGPEAALLLCSFKHHLLRT